MSLPIGNPPATVFPRKRSRCHFPPPTCHGISAKVFQVASPCFPPATETLQKCCRCLFPPSTWHGIPAKACQVSFPCRPPATETLRKCSRCPFLPSTWHGFPAKVFQVSFPAVHLARNSSESVPGVLSCRPPGTEFLRKCSRCPFLPSTWHGFPAKVFQVPLLRLPPGTAVPLIMGCRGFSAGQMSSFQHGACSRLHTREVCASF